MAINMLLNDVPVGGPELVMFPALTVVGIAMLALLLRAVTDSGTTEDQRDVCQAGLEPGRPGRGFNREPSGR